MVASVTCCSTVADLSEFDIPIRAQIALGNVIHRLRNVGPEDKTGAVAGRDVSQIATWTAADLDYRLRLEINYPGTGVGTLIACSEIGSSSHVVAGALLDFLADMGPTCFRVVSRCLHVGVSNNVRNSANRFG